MPGNTEKHKNFEKHTVGPGIWRKKKKRKTWKKRHTHCRTWNIARNSENHEKCEIHKQDLGYGNKTEKCGKRDTNTVSAGLWREN